MLSVKFNIPHELAMKLQPLENQIQQILELGLREFYADGQAESSSVIVPGSCPVQQSMQFPETVRTRFVRSILDSLEKVALHAGSSSAAVYINQILHSIHCMDEQFPDDPISDVLFALYDALAYNGQWINYTADLFEKAGEILKWCAGFTVLNSNQAEEAIMRLDKAGFEIIPYTVNIQEDI
ncbi:MAG: hypothetical protein GY795_27765 [Desulfobacterales bacterium]|nr:hypothetical protein [Desulfobacterales bacterium]